MTWFQRQRMDWIAECLRIYGYINRIHLVRKFDISAQQASTDLTGFSEANPGRMKYDPRRKTYVALDYVAESSAGSLLP